MPTTKQFTIENLSTGIRFSLPYRKRWVEILFMSFGIFVIFSAIFSLILNSLTGKTTGGFEILSSPIACLNITIVVLVGSVFLVEWLWLLIGLEIVEVTDDYIVIHHRILGIGFSKRIYADKIDNVFISRKGSEWFNDLLSSGGKLQNFKIGKIAINNGKTIFGEKRTFRFGSILDESEAEQIVSMIHQRFPKYRRSNSKNAG
jgi:hypothetical protein